MIWQKHEPTSFAECVNNLDAQTRIRKALIRYKQEGGRSLVSISGPTGSGKSLLARLAIEEYGFEPVIAIGEDLLSINGLMQRWATAHQSTLFGVQRVLVIEDLELAPPRVRTRVLKNVRKMKEGMVIITSGNVDYLEWYDRKLFTMVKLDIATEEDVLTVLRRVVRSEGWDTSEAELGTISRFCRTYRESMIALLTSHFGGYAEIQNRDTPGFKERVLRILVSGFYDAPDDPHQIIYWVWDNAHYLAPAVQANRFLRVDRSIAMALLNQCGGSEVKIPRWFKSVGIAKKVHGK